MESQTLFNIAVGLAGTFGGYILRSISESLKTLQETDVALTEKVQKIELLVAGEYVKHTDLEKLSNALFVKLDKIHDEMKTKADK